MRRKTGYAAVVLSLSLVLSLAAGCGGRDNRYSYREAGITALNEGNYEEAIESFDKAINVSKGLVGKVDMDILKYRAEAEYLSGNYKEAVNTYDKLIKADGRKPEYLNLRSVSKAETGDVKGALEDYRKSTELDKDGKAPGRLNALLATGALMEKGGAADDAMSLYQEALQAGENNARLLNRMGLCSMAKEDYDAAVGYFEQGLSAQDSAKVPELLFNQAVAKEYQGAFKEALELMQKYVSVHGPDEAAEREITFLKTR
ncbi:tetratricopeptide repeat protein [Lacrimispora sp. JR3]|uniref:tetratricopeptide repeat protein n=1 Tax=Lacrimispora sinapis TaxID=3111456 RepID=UPI003748711E